MFEPDPSDATKTTSLVATCGGNSICIIDVNSGTVLMKYKHKDIKENFYTLAWTTLKLGDDNTNILASGGIRGEIRMFHPASKVRILLDLCLWSDNICPLSSLELSISILYL